MDYHPEWLKVRKVLSHTDWPSKAVYADHTCYQNVLIRARGVGTVSNKQVAVIDEALRKICKLIQKINRTRGDQKFQQLNLRGL